MPKTQHLLSPLKYPGGKRKICDEIERRLPDGSFSLCEQFFGGGSLGLRLAGQGRLRKLVAGEACGPVRAFWDQLVRNESGLFHQIAHITDEYNKNPAEVFPKIRDAMNAHKGEDWLHRLGAQLLTLNRTCMNGLVRFNDKGEFNVPVGKRQDGSFYRFQPDFEHLDRVRAALVGCGFEIFPSWKEALAEARRGASECEENWVAYIDPPYTGGFVDYTADGWHSDDDIEVYEWAKSTAAFGVRVVLSQPDTEWARDCCSSILPGFQVDRIEVGRPINSDGKGRGPVGELLIWNKPTTTRMVDMQEAIKLLRTGEIDGIAIIEDEGSLV